MVKMGKTLKQDKDICLLCSKHTKEDRITGIFKNSRLMYVISKGAGINIKPDPGLPDTICYACIVNLNVYFDYQNRIRNNIKKLLLSYYINIGDMKKVERYKRQILPDKLMLPFKPPKPLPIVPIASGSSTPNKENPKNNPERITARNLFKMNNFIENNDTNGLIISNVHSGHNLNLMEANQSSTNNVDNEELTVSPLMSSTADQSISDSSFLLKPMFQTSENALDTESGGNIHVQNDQITAQRYSQMLCYCQFCPKVYQKPHYLKKHMKKHSKERRSKSICSDGGGEQTRKYLCQKVSNCNLTFTSASALKKHEKDHLKIVKCHFCSEEFNHLNDYRWHIICCEAKSKGKQNNQRQTRSISRAKSMISVHAQNDSTQNQTHYNNSSDGDEDYDENVDVDVETIDGNTDTDTNDENDGSESDSTSVADSVYSEKIRRLQKWRQNVNKISHQSPKHSKWEDKDENNAVDTETDSLSVFSDAESVSFLSREFSSSTESESHSDDMATEAKKRRRKHKEGKKKARRRGEDYFSCSYGINCSFGCNSLARTMNHERIVHNALLLYYCKECEEWFSTRENLIRHRKRHRAYYQNCIKCHQLFANAYDLEYHMMLHHEKSYACYFCCMSFLKESELDEHTAANHKNERVVKHGIITRNGTKPATIMERTQPFTGYKSKEMIQTPKTSPENGKYQHYRTRIDNFTNILENNERFTLRLRNNRRSSTTSHYNRLLNTNGEQHSNDSNQSTMMKTLRTDRNVSQQPLSSFVIDLTHSPVKEEHDDLIMDANSRAKSNNTVDRFNLFSIDALSFVADTRSSNYRNICNGRFIHNGKRLSKFDRYAIKNRQMTGVKPLSIIDKCIPSYDNLFNRQNEQTIYNALSFDSPFRYPE